MKTISLYAAMFVVASFLPVGAATAQTTGATAGATCKTQAGTLHGAAMTSKVKSCCRQQATAQKLHGAAEKSFRTSCEKAGLGT
ncbi:MAG: hypothetical protein ACRECV_08065 [Xanthobacteraceae bacterium]